MGGEDKSEAVKSEQLRKGTRRRMENDVTRRLNEMWERKKRRSEGNHKVEVNGEKHKMED